MPRLQRTPGPDPQYDDVCYKGASSNGDQLGEVFPTFKVRDHKYCIVRPKQAHQLHSGQNRTSEVSSVCVCGAAECRYRVCVQTIHDIY